MTGQISPVDLTEAGLQDPEAGDSSQALADSDNPFAQYEAEYQFPGTANPNVAGSAGTRSSNLAASSAGRPAGTGSSSSSGSQFNFGSGLVNPAAPNTNSALSEALNRQSAREAAAAQEGGQRAPSATTPALPTSDGSATQPVAPAPGTVSVPFIRTTPNMSPPAGGTGYQPPATSDLPAFNVAPQQPTPNPYNLPSGVQSQRQFAVPTQPSLPSVESASPGGTAYTPPTFTQPDQGRPINPRR